MKILNREEAYAQYIGAEWYDAHQHIEYPEGFRARLMGKSVEDQMKMFALVENVEFSRSGYGDTEKSWIYRYARRLTSVREFRGLVVENGIIEGVIIKTMWKETPMGPYDTITTYYASDDNGSGSKDREDTVTLICLPPDKEWD